LSEPIQSVADKLAEAKRILFLTGAGVSADSGLPTYRGVGGLYDGDATDEGVAIETALSGPMFRSRPELTWKYLWQIASACHGARPNAAHRIIAEIEAARPEVWVVTQNVDGLHRAAGSRNLVEVHGHMYDLFCSACGGGFDASALLDGGDAAPELPPRCERCGGVVRPRVVLFDELLAPDVARSLTRLALTDFDVVVAVGTTAEFPYIREPVLRAGQRGAVRVEINPAPTSLSHAFDLRLRMGAAEAFQRIRAAMG
jgi:NAD-dependent deacetylase